MLRKIAIQDLRLGMHLHELCGPWLDHPFWRAKFLLADPADIAKLNASGITECWIDNAKGLDAAAPAPQVESPPAPAAPIAQAAAELRPPTPCSLNEELSRAALLVKKSRTAVMSLFSEARMGKTMNTEQCVELVGEITESVWRNPGALVSLARLKTHDDYSYMHSVAVCALMVSLSRQLGQSEVEARDAGMAGLLHDMGKALMPIEVLNKPGKLTDAEYELIKTHPARGHELLLGGSASAGFAASEGIFLDACRHAGAAGVDRPEAFGLHRAHRGARVECGVAVQTPRRAVGGQRSTGQDRPLRHTQNLRPGRAALALWLALKLRPRTTLRSQR